MHRGAANGPNFEGYQLCIPAFVLMTDLFCLCFDLLEMHQLR
jgi:hypothetical protein